MGSRLTALGSGSRPLALHQITAPGADALELVAIAAAAGCAQVCVFVHSPANLRSIPNGPPRVFPVIRAGEEREMRNRLDNFGVTVRNLEFFPLHADTRVEDYREAIELGARLGGERLVTHIHDPDERRAVDNLGRLCELAQMSGLEVGLEFMPMSRGCPTLQHARALIAKVNRPECRIAVDILHFVRSAGKLADLAEAPPSSLAYAQICDGIGLHSADFYMPDAIDRLIPGEGDFPISAFINGLPADLPIDVEVPTTRLAEMAMSPADHALRAVSAVRRILEQDQV